MDTISLINNNPTQRNPTQRNPTMATQPQREQKKDSDDLQRQTLAALLDSTLPLQEGSVVYAFGYGSGVFSQHINKDDKDTEHKVIDMIIVVKDALQFHRANAAHNPLHYTTSSSSSSSSSPEWCTWWQRHSSPCRWLGRNPGVYFVLTDTLKYGVVQVDDLCDDLKHWKYLYLAGRMHKPILPIPVSSSSSSLSLLSSNNHNEDEASRITNLQQNVNLPGALAMALCRLSLSSDNDKGDNNTDNDKHPLPTRRDVVTTTKQEGKEDNVYANIAQLSYQGDFRVWYGAEDPQKITRLVQGPGQLARFRSLYAQAASRLQQQGILSIQEDKQCNHNDNNCTTPETTSSSCSWTWDTSPASLSFLQSQIPLSLSSAAASQSSQQQAPYTNVSNNDLHAIVAPAARYQSIKGILTAGPIKACKYAARKLAKGILRR